MQRLPVLRATVLLLALAAAVAAVHGQQSEIRQQGAVRPQGAPAPTGSDTLLDAAPHHFVEVDGHRFRLRDRPFYYAGFNTYYMMVYAADPALRYAVDEILFEADDLGLSVLRTWAFNDGAGQWNALQTSPGVYQEFVFEGLDYVLAQAAAYDIKVILSLVNNWDDYGGMNQYVAWSPTASQHDHFYTDANCRQWYRDHARVVIERVNTYTGRMYRDDPTIFAWELGNEPRCSSDTTGDTLQAWIEEMAAHVKNLDPYHLVTTGSEGFYGPAEAWKNPRTWMKNQGVDFTRNHAAYDIDFASTHVWPDNYGIDFTESIDWVNGRIADTQTVLGKPLVVSEMGKFRPLAERDAYFQTWYDAIYASAFLGGAGAGSNFWILYHDDYPDYDGFGVYYPDDASTLLIIYTEAQKMNAL